MIVARNGTVTTARGWCSVSYCTLGVGPFLSSPYEGEIRFTCRSAEPGIFDCSDSRSLP